MVVYYTKSSGAKTRTYIVRDVESAFPAGRGKVNVKLKDGTLKQVSDVLWLKDSE